MQDGAHAEGGCTDAEEAGSQAEGAEHATAGSGKSSVHNGIFGALFAIRWRLPASALQRSSDSVYAAIPLHLEPAWGEESGC